MIGKFDCSVEDWVSYMEKLDQYFVANGIGTTESDLPKRRAVLLTCYGPSACVPANQKLDSTRLTDFEDLLKLVKDHEQPPPSAIIRRYNFNIRVQVPGEP